MYEFIPNELKKFDHWICWKAVPDPKSHSGISKIPIDPHNGGMASSTDPQTWSDFDTAVERSGDFAGIGFVFEKSGYFGVDLDDVDLDSALVHEFVDTLKSYTELSFSGNGIHIICRGKLPEGRRRKGNIEMYDSGRFFVMTGKYFAEYTDIADGSETIKSLHKKYLSDQLKTPNSEPKIRPVSSSLTASEIIKKASNSANGEKFKKLFSGDFSDYPSQSEADMAFCNMLAFWCKGDAGLMDEVYRNSGMMRPKWDRKQTGTTYGRIIINKAIQQCDSFYGDKKSDYSVSIKPANVNSVSQIPNYSLDDTGNAQRLRDAFGDSLKWSYIDKRWLYYKDGKWNYDNIGQHRAIADAVVELLENERSKYSDDGDAEKAFNKHIKRSRSFSGKTNMMRESEHLLSILPSVLDKNKTLLNCKNGIIDLRTGSLHPHEKKAYITKMADCEYNTDAPVPELWLRFLDDIFGGDRDLIRYVQKAVGYSMSGSTAEQCAFFLYGTGRNGKSTFLEIIRCIMGDYATNIQPQTIMIKPNSGSAPNSDIARLKGARFVTSVEPNEGMKIDEGLLKQLTGDDIVTARRLYGDEFEFKPEFKLWMATNHKPIIRGTDTGIWRRIHMIPFEVQIPEGKVDKHLKYKLAKEMQGIFKWAIEGCRLWQTEGLAMPRAVLDAVKEYRKEMDVISAFIEACCTVGQGDVRASQLYAVYCRWADSNNEYKMSSTKFGREMAKKFEKVRANSAIVYKGISLGADVYPVSIG